MSKIRVALLAGIALAATSVSGVVTASAATHTHSTATTRTKATPAMVVAKAGTAASRAVYAARSTHSSAKTPAAAQRPVAHLDPQTSTLPTTKGGLVRVQVSGPGAGTAAQKAGGRVLATSRGVSSVFVPKAKLAQLAESAGVSDVTVPDKAYTDAPPAAGSSEATGVSGATSWISGGQTGAGVKLAIVDAGFGSSASEYTSEVGLGHLGTSPVVQNDGCLVDGSPSVYDDPHGLETAELAHQMAPDAQLYLFCINDSVGFNQAEGQIVTDGIKLVSSSLSFPGDSRGDGTGAVDSAAAAVEAARKAGVLWIESAGNQAQNHWGGAMTDLDHDGLVDIGGEFNRSKSQFEDDVDFVAGTDSSATPTSTDIFLQWNQWPATSASVSLLVYGYQCQADFGSNGCQATPLPSSGIDGSTLSVTHSPGGSPVLEINTDVLPNYSTFDQYWQVIVEVGASMPTVRYDLNYYGNVDGASLLACPTFNETTNTCNVAPPAYTESISEPASSPYALAVGAADVGVDGEATGFLEPFSSRGPTIDGRTKPDITGWDGVSSFLPEYSQYGFYGTSASAPVVAGAAALVAGSNPDLDASQIQAFLEQRANSGHPNNPPTQAEGHGLLTMGAVGTAEPPIGTSYTPISPLRVYDTRTTSPGMPTHKGQLPPGGTATVSFPAGSIPADATSVVINLTGTRATGSTYLAAYAGGTYPGTSNLNLSTVDSTAAVLAAVTLSSSKTITIHNATHATDVIVDLVGYFEPGTGEGLFSTPAPGSTTRVLDTRSTVGGHPGKLDTGGSVTVDPQAPTGATAVVINLTAANPGKGGFFNASPACSLSSSTLNVTKFNRANMAIVKLDSSGTFCIESSAAPADIIVDVLGFFGTQSGGSAYYSLPSPVRVLDSRFGNGGQTTGHPVPIGPNRGQSVFAAGVGEVPTMASSLFTDVVEADATTGSFLAAYAGGTAPTTTPATSTLNFSPTETVANAAIVGTSDDQQFGIYNSTGNTDAVVDLEGYFLPVSG